MGEGKLPILGFTLTQHLTGFQAGNPKAVKVSRKYQRQMDRREEKMEQFAKGELSRADYLREMGAISLKADKAASRMLVEEGDVFKRMKATIHHSKDIMQLKKI